MMDEDRSGEGEFFPIQTTHNTSHHTHIQFLEIVIFDFYELKNLTIIQ